MARWASCGNFTFGAGNAIAFGRFWAVASNPGWQVWQSDGGSVFSPFLAASMSWQFSQVASFGRFRSAERPDFSTSWQSVQLIPTSPRCSSCENRSGSSCRG